jgi:hypothetical protein
MNTNENNYLRNLEQIDNKVRHHENLPDPLMMVVCGSTGSGKTYLTMKMLLTDHFLDYNNLIIFTPTPEQKDYLLLKHGFKNNLSKSSMLAIRGILDNYRDEQIEAICVAYKESHPEDVVSNTPSVTFYERIHEIPPPTKLDKYKKNLIIFDDCVELKNQLIIESYFTKGRHNNCSCIYLAQNFYGIPKGNIRTQLTAIVLFKLGQRDKRNAFEHVETFMDRPNYYQEVEGIWRTKHNYIYINKLAETMTSDVFA